VKEWVRSKVKEVEGQMRGHRQIKGVMPWPKLHNADHTIPQYVWPLPH
jgi:hypothetical protein